MNPHPSPSVQKIGSSKYLVGNSGYRRFARYKGEKISKKYIPDVFCFGKIILELKAAGALAPLIIAEQTEGRLFVPMFCLM